MMDISKLKDNGGAVQGEKLIRTTISIYLPSNNGNLDMVQQRPMLDIHVTQYKQLTSEQSVRNCEPMFDFQVCCCNFLPRTANNYSSVLL